MIGARRGRVVLVGALALVGCAEPPAREVPRREVPPASLLLDRATLTSPAMPDLVSKLERNRFRYFRMLAPAYEQRTCAAFADLADLLPLTALHGDAHVEQFVVTAKTYGLEDFDRAGFGPAVIDLVRYAASLHVACASVDWTCDPDAAVERFLQTYRAALVAPPGPSEPAIVRRLRARAPTSRASWLAWVDTLMTPLSPEITAKIALEWQVFATQMASSNPSAQTGLGIVRVGSLRMGYGSAAERKVLIRVAGPTADPDDDVVVEAREGTLAPTDSCMIRGYYGESIVLMFKSILGRRMAELHGLVGLFGTRRYFWLQSWDPGYVELSLGAVLSQRELESLAVDAANQLGGQLWQRAPTPRRRNEQFRQLLAFDFTRARVVALARALAAETDLAWETFKAGRPVDRAASPSP